MASTIITKNKTSGAPSSLAAGELAINTTDGGFYYGSSGGTSVSSSIKFGAVTASNVNATGHISSSAGNVYALDYFDNQVNINAIYSARAGSTAITTLGTITAGTWASETAPIASLYLDADTAHLSGTQTFTGTKTLNSFKGTAGATVTNILDEDAMGSDSATALATQQSIKAYTDTMLPLAGGTMTGDIAMGDNDISNIKSIAFNDGDATITEIKDEDNMASNSATMLATQQSIKTYADRPAKMLHILYANFKDNMGTTEHFIPLAGVPDENVSANKEQVAIIMPAPGAVKEIILRCQFSDAITVDDDITWKVHTRAKNKMMNGSTQIGTFDMDNPLQTDGEDDNTRTTGAITHSFNKYDALFISMQWANEGPDNIADRVYVTVVTELDVTGLGY